MLTSESEGGYLLNRFMTLPILCIYMIITGQAHVYVRMSYLYQCLDQHGCTAESVSFTSGRLPETLTVEAST